LATYSRVGRAARNAPRGIDRTLPVPTAGCAGWPASIRDMPARSQDRWSPLPTATELALSDHFGGRPASRVASRHHL